MIIKTENLSKKFTDNRALDDINIEIKEGEVLAILGASGAGKTTLLRILNLLERPTSGEIYFNGRNVDSYPSFTPLRRKMAMVIQGAPVFDTSVYNNIAWGLKVRCEDKKSVREKVTYVLKLVGLEGYEKRNARTLSGGEAQRVAFAMAVVFKPEVLLLDEPTANLDPITEELIEDLISQINRMGITIVIATHKQHEAINLANRVIVINDGKIAQAGTPNEIFHKPRTEFVARFTGAKNILGGTVVKKDGEQMVVKTKDFDIHMPSADADTGDIISFCIRPEDVMILRADIQINSERKNVFEGRIRKITPYGGSLIRIHILAKKTIFFADVPRHVIEKMELAREKDILFSLKSSAIKILEAV